MNLNLRVVAFLLSLASVVFAIVLGVSIGSEEYLLPTIVIAIFAAIMLMGRPQIAAFGTVVTFSCGLTLPGLPGQMNLFEAFALALLGIYGLQVAMKTNFKLPISKPERILFVFCAWILFIGAYRGFGFLAFGSSKIGGFNYLHLLLAASIVFTLPRIGISTSMWKPTFIMIGLLAPSTLLADILVTKGFAFGIVRLFLHTSSEIGSMVQETEMGGSDVINRLYSAGPAATGMLLALLCLVPANKFFKFTGIQWLLAFASIVTLSLLSGYRLMTASLLVMIALAFFFQKEITIPRIAGLCCVACLGLFGVYAYSRDLPNNVQRAISWLPGIDVSNAALGDASGTVDWRLKVWQEALNYIPDYWIVGKGFSYEAQDVIASFYDPEGVDWALAVGSYHNGWLSMILCTGIIGLALGLYLLIFPTMRHWRRQFEPWRNPDLKRYHCVFLAAQVTLAVTFVTIYGDVHVSFPVLFYQWALLETISLADTNKIPIVNALEGRESESIYQEN
jgi:hypothetical protein